MPKTHTIRLARRNGATTINLAQKRTWYAEGDAGDQQQQQSQGDANLPTTLEGWQKLAEAREKRIKERDDEVKSLKAQYTGANQRLTAIEQAQQERLAKQGDFETLAQQRAAEVESLKPFAQRTSELEAVIREDNEAIIKSIPEQMRSIIPTDYPPEKLKRWLTTNMTLLSKQPAPNYDAGAGVGGGGGNNGSTPKLTADELDVAKRMGMSAEDYAKAKSKLPKKE
jgi:hypothetical protein